MLILKGSRMLRGKHLFIFFLHTKYVIFYSFCNLCRTFAVQGYFGLSLFTSIGLYDIYQRCLYLIGNIITMTFFISVFNTVLRNRLCAFTRKTTFLQVQKTVGFNFFIDSFFRFYSKGARYIYNTRYLNISINFYQYFFMKAHNMFGRYVDRWRMWRLESVRG